MAMSGSIRRKMQLMATVAKTLTIDAEAHVIADDPVADYAPGLSDNRWLTEVSEAGEDNLIIGSDYGHADTTSESAALSTFRSTSPVGQRIANKMFGDNARTLYAL